MNAVGQPISRVDGRLKVTGGARYTADIPVAGAALAGEQQFDFSSQLRVTIACFIEQVGAELRIALNSAVK